MVVDIKQDVDDGANLTYTDVGEEGMLCDLAGGACGGAFEVSNGPGLVCFGVALADDAAGALPLLPEADFVTCGTGAESVIVG